MPAEELSMADQVARLPLWYGVFLFSLTFHEFAHAVAARLGGDDTAYLGGQHTLDPAPHIRREPFGLVVIPLLTYFMNAGAWMIGWASVPYNPYWEIRYPKRAAAMALCGPSSNFLLAAVAAGALKAMTFNHTVELAPGFAPFLFSASSGWVEIVAAGLYLMVFLNVILGVLNMMPFPPFDGSAIPGLFLTHENRMKFQELGRRYYIVGLLAGWFLTDRILGLFLGPLMRWVVGL